MTDEQWNLRAADEKATRPDSVVCPFCQEDGFDLIGLKHHLLSCDELAKTEAINFIRTRPAAALEKETRVVKDSLSTGDAK